MDPDEACFQRNSVKAAPMPFIQQPQSLHKGDVAVASDSPVSIEAALHEMCRGDSWPYEFSNGEVEEIPPLRLGRPVLLPTETAPRPPSRFPQRGRPPSAHIESRPSPLEREVQRSEATFLTAHSFYEPKEQGGSVTSSERWELTGWTYGDATHLGIPACRLAGAAEGMLSGLRHLQ
jgi:hypothetical protein